MIFRKENDKILNVEIGIASEVLDLVNDSTDLITIKTVKSRANSLGMSILSNFYNDYLVYVKKNNPSIKLDGFIVPKPGSLLSLINYNDIDENFVRYNLPILNNETKTQFADKVVDIVTKVNNINGVTNNAIEKINTILPTLNIAKPIFDYFTVQEFEIFKTYYYMKDVNYLTKFHKTNTVNKEHLPELMGVLKTNVQTLAKITSDLELNEYIQTDVGNLLNKDDFIAKVGSLIDHYELNDLNMNQVPTTAIYEDSVNENIVLLAYLLDLYNKTKGNYDNGTVNALETIINFFIDEITKAVKIIDNKIKSNIVIYKIEKDNENNFTVYVYEKNFGNLKENNVKLETVLGYVVYADNKGVTPITSTMSNLQIKADVYNGYFDAFRNNIILTNKNNLKSKLINIYILVISEFFSDRANLEDIKSYLTVLPISQLQDIKNVVRNIVSIFIYPNNNGYDVFFNGIKEATELLPNNGSVTELAGYATYKFILYYLAQQTYIK